MKVPFINRFLSSLITFAYNSSSTFLCHFVLSIAYFFRFYFSNPAYTCFFFTLPSHCFYDAENPFVWIRYAWVMQIAHWSDSWKRIDQLGRSCLCTVERFHVSHVDNLYLFFSHTYTSNNKKRERNNTSENNLDSFIPKSLLYLGEFWLFLATIQYLLLIYLIYLPISHTSFC